MIAACPCALQLSLLKAQLCIQVFGLWFSSGGCLMTHLKQNPENHLCILVFCSSGKLRALAPWRPTLPSGTTRSSSSRPTLLEDRLCANDDKSKQRRLRQLSALRPAPFAPGRSERRRSTSERCSTRRRSLGWHAAGTKALRPVEIVVVRSSFAGGASESRAHGLTTNSDANSGSLPLTEVVKIAAEAQNRCPNSKARRAAPAMVVAMGGTHSYSRCWLLRAASPSASTSRPQTLEEGACISQYMLTRFVPAFINIWLAMSIRVVSGDWG